MTLAQIQQNLREKNCDVFLVAHGNHFIGQDVLPQENRILELTGFDGSDGLLLITPSQALLFVDGRYELQAARQIDTKKIGVICAQKKSLLGAACAWLRQNMPSAFVCANTWHFSVSDHAFLLQMLPNIRFVAAPELAATAPAKVFALPQKFSGQSFADKKAKLIEMLDRQGVKAFLCTAADSVSWLTNLRSDALPETPLLRAMAIIETNGNCTFFADNITLFAGCAQTFLPFSKLESCLQKLSASALGCDFCRTPQEIARIAERCKLSLFDLKDPCQELKSRKNPVELRGFQRAHLRDGVALCRFMYWLEHRRQPLSECQIVQKLHRLRQEQPLFYSESFATIAGSGENAAVVHYHPNPQNDTLLTKNNLLLVDSGAQYFDGTTDVTRTFAIGKPSAAMRRHYTLVLKAHIALASLTFPQGVAGSKLDTVCRSVMWRFGLDYAHGTGHGVGHFLCVHEGPVNFGFRGSSSPVEAGNVMSIEPGYYQAGAYGIRIENLMFVAPCKQENMLKFEFLTLAPLDKRLIDKYLLTGEELDRINRYHRLVCRKILPHLSVEAERIWLQRACSPL